MCASAVELYAVGLPAPSNAVELYAVGSPAPSNAAALASRSVSSGDEMIGRPRAGEDEANARAVALSRGAARGRAEPRA